MTIITFKNDSKRVSVYTDYCYAIKNKNNETNLYNFTPFIYRNYDIKNNIISLTSKKWLGIRDKFKVSWGLMLYAKNSISYQT